MEAVIGAVTAEVTDSKAADPMDSMVEAMRSTGEVTASMADTMGTMVDTMDTIGIMGTDTTAAAGGFRGSSVSVGVIRGTDIRGLLVIPTTARTMATRMGVTTAVTVIPTAGITAATVIPTAAMAMAALGTTVATAIMAAMGTMAATGTMVAIDIPAVMGMAAIGPAVTVAITNHSMML